MRHASLIASILMLAIILAAIAGKAHGLLPLGFSTGA
jgi:hypothetical protein